MALFSFATRSSPLTNAIRPPRPGSGRLNRHAHRLERRRQRLLLCLRLVWTLTILWAEWFCFHRSISSCSWPQLPPHSPDSPLDQAQQSSSQPFKLLVIADPQLPSTAYSYPTRPYPLRLLSVKIIEQFIRKAWRLIIRTARPDAIIFLGDLLDGGVATIDPLQFATYVDTFWRTFPIPAYLRAPPDTPRVVFLAGNHDLGLAPHTSPANSTLARERFTRTWPPGQLNGQLEWGNHTVIWLDAIGLIEEAKRRAAGQLAEHAGPATEFVNGLVGREMLLPKVLLSHVPLWRPDGTACGPLRESRREIRQGAGKNYQNELPQDLTRMILERIQPALVLSGDDHDYCEVVHTLPSSSLANPSPLAIPEVSVKSFSMGMGIARPGYELVTLANPARFARAPEDQTAFRRACELPSQVWLYTHVYLPAYLLTLGVLFGPPVWRLVRRSMVATRQQAKTNGLPLRHRSQGHRKSLSRTLMFQKPASGSLSSGSSSEPDDGRSDEEAVTRYAGHGGRRSLSGPLGALDGADGYGSPTGMLSYHSPVDSGHEDDRLSHPSPALDSTHAGRSPGLAEGDYLPFYHPRSARPMRGLGTDGLLMACISLIAGKRASSRVKKWLVRRGLWRRTPLTGNGRGKSAGMGEFECATRDHVLLLTWIFAVYFAVWGWFWW